MQRALSSTATTSLLTYLARPIRSCKTWPTYVPSGVEATCQIDTAANEELACFGSQFEEDPTSFTANDAPLEAAELVAQSSFKDLVFEHRRKLATQLRHYASISTACVDQDSTSDETFFHNLDILDILLQWLCNWQWQWTAIDSTDPWPSRVGWLECRWECALKLLEQIHDRLAQLKHNQSYRYQQFVVNQIWHRFRQRQIGRPLHIWMAACVLGDIEFEALADQGSGRNILSPRKAKLLGHTGYAVLSSAVRLLLPNGKSVRSGGRMSLPFHFPAEERLEDLQDFEILPGSIYDVILGSSLLQKTETFTTHRKRLTSVLIHGPNLRRCSYLAEVRTVVTGFIDGMPCEGVPDTGSNVPLMSKKEADRLGLTVVIDPAYQVSIQFANGDTALTEGVVLDTDVWLQGQQSFESIDWFILSSLPVSVIFCKSMVSDPKFWHHMRNNAHAIDSAIPVHRQGAEEARLLQRQVLQGRPTYEEFLQRGAYVFILAQYRKAWFTFDRARASEQPSAEALAADAADSAIQDEKGRESERQLHAEQEIENAEPKDRAGLLAAEEERKRIYKQRQALALQGNQAPSNNPQAP